MRKQIDAVSENGSYKVYNAVVKNFKSVTLSTSHKTRIEKSDSDIKPLVSSIANVTFKAHFPPENIRLIQRRYWCARCKKYQQNKCPNPILFSCLVCSSTAMSTRVKKNTEVRVDMNVGGETKSITIPCPQLEEYFKKVSGNIPNNDEDISLALFKDNSTVMFYDARHLCVGFEE